MHILQIIIKNTSTMDFTVPVLWRLSESYPDIKITVFYCVLDRRNILRKSKFWDHFFESHNINQLDYCDYLRPTLRPFKKLFRYIFSISSADKIHLKEVLEFYKLNNKKSSHLGFLLFLIQEYGFLKLINNLLRGLVVLFERRFTLGLIEVSEVLPRIAPDLILFDNRSVSNFPGRQVFYDWIYKNKVPVALIPHAPHLRDPVSEFCAFDEKGESLPNFCDFWIPLHFGTPWVKMPEKRKQFHVTGYPGLDSDWLEWCRKGNGSSPRMHKKDEPLRVLFIMRRYLPRGKIRPNNTDPYIIDYEDFFIPLTRLISAFKELDIEIELILKPHPANNYTILATDMERAGVHNWRISHEPIYPLLSEVDMVVSLFSTILLVPTMAGIPTLLLKTSLQETVHSEWDVLEGLYTNLQYYVDDLDKLTSTLRNILVKIGTDLNLNSEESIDALRYYYQNGAISKTIARINDLVKQKYENIL